MKNFYCYNIAEGKTLTHFSNKTVNFNKLARLIPFYVNIMPYIYSDENKICGALIKLVTELSIKYGYGY